jgi:hypothetical protein
MSPAEATGVKERPATSTTLPGVTLHIRSIPGSQARHVIKVAVLPNAASPEAAIEMVVRAKGMSGSLAFPVEHSLDEPEAAPNIRICGHTRTAATLRVRPPVNGGSARILSDFLHHST